MATRGKLSKYREKRDFRRTPEPKSGGGRRRRGPRFVIQKHDASRLHYDFRLEIDGVLESWAVPKGPSTDPRERRLAVMTEPHPLDYADFEGVIPEGEYGGGTVLVWDRGTFESLREEPLARSLADGRIEVRLDGEKLRGGYVLVRTRGRGKDAERSWLLIKKKDEGADARRNPVKSQPESVLTGRTIEEIAEEEAEAAGGA